MDAALDEIAGSLLNQRLPDNWRKLAPETCMQLAAWLNHLQVNRAFQLFPLRIYRCCWHYGCATHFVTIRSLTLWTVTQCRIVGMWMCVCVNCAQMCQCNSVMRATIYDIRWTFHHTFICMVLYAPTKSIWLKSIFRCTTTIFDGNKCIANDNDVDNGIVIVIKLTIKQQKQQQRQKMWTK